MRNALLPLLVAGTTALGACTYPYGLGGPDVLGGGALPAGASAFERDAVNACGTEAARYGRVDVTEVARISSSTLRVSGIVDVSTGYYGGIDRRTFECDFRSDGRIADFDIH